MFPIALGILGSAASEIVLVVAIFLVLYIIFKLGKSIFGLLTNSILGLISIFALNSLFGIGIPISWLTIIATALFGLPAVAVMVILRLFGIAF
ncbi:MAG: pro-sigmaK processing inhibitor BofA family protein [Candidatus Micrarchaeota archaeon]|nr:pro-sigmaK processing inhibitor BofA family protein [Candidatus Micrarchaeota archaeon]